MTNHASIELSFATGNSAAGSNENKSELILMLFTENPATNPDADANGLPDQWENQYFSGQTVNPLADADGGGISNLMEYVAGTNPTDPSSTLISPSCAPTQWLFQGPPAESKFPPIASLNARKPAPHPDTLHRW